MCVCVLVFFVSRFFFTLWSGNFFGSLFSAIVRNVAFMHFATLRFPHTSDVELSLFDVKNPNTITLNYSRTRTIHVHASTMPYEHEESATMPTNTSNIYIALNIFCLFCTRGAGLLLRPANLIRFDRNTQPLYRRLIQSSSIGQLSPFDCSIGLLLFFPSYFSAFCFTPFCDLSRSNFLINFTKCCTDLTASSLRFFIRTECV